jgi:hypothetical protein
VHLASPAGPKASRTHEHVDRRWGALHLGQ